MSPQSDEIARLRVSVDNLADTVERERQARRLTIIVVAVASLLVVSVLGYGLIDNRRNLDAINASRAEARVAACTSYNEQQARSRDGNKAQIRVVFAALTTQPLDAERQARLDELYAAHDAEMDAAFPDRDCSPEGIAAFYEAKP